MSCGLIIGGASGYRMICGGLWCGEIVLCDECEEAELRKRVLRKQEALLDKELKSK